MKDKHYHYFVSFITSNRCGGEFYKSDKMNSKLLQKIREYIITKYNTNEIGILGFYELECDCDVTE